MKLSKGIYLLLLMLLLQKGSHCIFLADLFTHYVPLDSLSFYHTSTKSDNTYLLFYGYSIPYAFQSGYCFQHVTETMSKITNNFLLLNSMAF